MRPVRLASLLAAACAVAAGCGGSSSAPAGPAPAASSPASTASHHARSGRLTPAAARRIVAELWTQREAALSALSGPEIGRLETAVAATEDRAYAGDVRCGCASAKAGHTIMSILPEIPRSAPDGAFFAQVRTTNTTTGELPWYVIAVVRRGAYWKIAYVNFGGYKARPPLSALGVTPGTVAAVTPRDRARMVRIARLETAWAGAHATRVEHTSYGATIRARAALRPEADGVFGLTLPGGRVFACYTLHELDTYTLRGGLAQDAAREQWGRQLAPGGYRSIVVDTDQPYCVAGTGRGSTVPPTWLQYTPQRVAVTGTRLF